MFLLGALVVAQPTIPVTPPTAQASEEDLNPTFVVSGLPSVFTNSWLEREPLRAARNSLLCSDACKIQLPAQSEHAAHCL